MKIKSSYIIIPVLVFLFALVGQCFTSMGMIWYQSELIQSGLTPPNWVFPVVWNVIFICLAISAIMAWEKRMGRLIIGFFIVSGVANALWSLIFFVFHLILLSFIEALVLELIVIGLIILLWKKSKIAALLLLPYAVWMIFANFLIYRTMLMNI